MEAKGHCLCGACEFTIELKARHFDACHCSMCRRWGGSPVMAVKAEKGIHFKDVKKAFGFEGDA